MAKIIVSERNACDASDLEGYDLLVLTEMGEEVWSWTESDSDILNGYEREEDVNTYSSDELLEKKISIRQLLDCWNEKHGTAY